MGMDIWILAVVSLGAGVAAAWAVKRRWFAPESGGRYLDDVEEPRPISVTRNQPSTRNKRYYGVSVQPGNNPCKAIEKIRWCRYLTHEAPRLPLPGCKRPECRCFLMPENDRRGGFDRRGDSFTAFGDYDPHAHKRRRDTGPDRRGK